MYILYTYICIHVHFCMFSFLHITLSLGGESAVKLLAKFGLLDAAIEYATDNQFS